MDVLVNVVVVHIGLINAVHILLLASHSKCTCHHRINSKCCSKGIDFTTYHEVAHTVLQCLIRHINYLKSHQ